MRRPSDSDSSYESETDASSVTICTESRSSESDADSSDNDFIDDSVDFIKQPVLTKSSTQRARIVRAKPTIQAIRMK